MISRRKFLAATTLTGVSIVATKNSFSNIVEEISKSVTENEALVETSNVVLKWKKL